MTTTWGTALWSELTDIAERVTAEDDTLATGAVQRGCSPSVAHTRQNGVRIATVQTEALARAAFDHRCAGVGP